MKNYKCCYIELDKVQSSSDWEKSTIILRKTKINLWEKIFSVDIFQNQTKSIITLDSNVNDLKWALNNKIKF